MDNNTAVSIAGQTEASFEASGDVDSMPDIAVQTTEVFSRQSFRWGALPPGLLQLFLERPKMESKELHAVGIKV